jgi:hypothetical protein
MQAARAGMQAAEPEVIVAAALAAIAAVAVASTVVEAAATAVVVDTGKIRLDARNEKPVCFGRRAFCMPSGSEIRSQFR